MLSVKRDNKTAKKFFKKMLGNPHVSTPIVMNVDKNPAFPSAHQQWIVEGDLPPTSKLRRVKYLNNVVENDHKSVDLNHVTDNSIRRQDCFCCDQRHGNDANDTKRSGKMPSCGRCMYTKQIH